MSTTLELGADQQYNQTIIPPDAIFTRVQEHANNALRIICNTLEAERKKHG